MKTLTRLAKAALVAALALANFACYSPHLDDVGGGRVFDWRSGEIWESREKPRSPLP